MPPWGKHLNGHGNPGLGAVSQTLGWLCHPPTKNIAKGEQRNEIHSIDSNIDRERLLSCSTAVLVLQCRRTNRRGRHIVFGLHSARHPSPHFRRRTLGDGFPSISMGITVKVPDSLAFESGIGSAPGENTPRAVNSPFSLASVWGIGHGFAVGGRAAFVSTHRSLGLHPASHNSWPDQGATAVFFKVYFGRSLSTLFGLTGHMGAEIRSGSRLAHFGVGF